MMPGLIDLTGARFGRLTVVRRSWSDKGGKPAWYCHCDCGTIKDVRGSDLRGGAVLSCGCLRNERVRETISTHGDSPRRAIRPEYNVWLAMRARCSNPARPDFHYYGGRGIRVCDRWRNDYAAFIADMGRRPSAKHTIDRIDVNGNYEPGNCRWATWPEQRRNTRDYIARHGEQNA